MPAEQPQKRRCAGKTKAGKPCGRYAVGRGRYCARCAKPVTPPPKPEPDWEKFLEEFERTGMVVQASREIGIHKQRAYEHRNIDPDFARRWDETVERTTEIMEREAYRRATVGTVRPVYQGGAQVGEIREHSDVLLMFMLKARRPEVYRERHSIEHTGAGGGALTHRIAVHDLSKLTDEQLAALETLNGDADRPIEG